MPFYLKHQTSLLAKLDTARVSIKDLYKELNKAVLLLMSQTTISNKAMNAEIRYNMTILQNINVSESQK